jgi:hypothetical protein
MFHLGGIPARQDSNLRLLIFLIQIDLPPPNQLQILPTK